MSPQLIGRLLLPVAVLSALLLAIAFGSAWYVRGIQRAVSDVMTNNVNSVRAAQELEISIRETRSQLDRYLITLDKKTLDPVPRMRERTGEALVHAENTATTEQERALMRRVRTGLEHFFAQYDGILANPNQAQYPKILDLIDTVFAREILEPAHEYARLNEGMLTRDAATNRKLADWITLGLVALGLCGSVGGLLAGTVIAVAIRRSLLRTEQRLRTTAEQLDEAAHPGRLARLAGRVAGTEPGDAAERMRVSALAVLQRLRQTERDALRAEQLAWVGQMAAGIAHEIRNPLMAIKVLVQAAAGRPGGLRPRDLQVLEEEIVRLEQIVSGFLDFARPPRPEPRPVDVKDLAERTAEGVQARAGLQGVAIRVEPATGPTVASADPNQIRQVLFNLLFNALEAQPGGGEIVVRTGIHTPPGGFPELEVRVEDAGPGLPASLGDQIFEAFVTTKESGLGLGLSICRRIVEGHAGTLRAEPRTSGGAAFVLRLPVLAPQAGA